MFPEKYAKDLESSRKRRKFFSYLAVSSVFVVCALFIGQIIHEGTHLAWLALKDCPYRVSLGLGNAGLYGSVKPLCGMTDLSLVVFYLSGYTSTILAAGITGLIGTAYRKSSTLLGASSGLLMSVLLSVTLRGDISRASTVLGASNSVSIAFSALIALGVLGTTLKSADLAFEQLERKEGSGN